VDKCNCGIGGSFDEKSYLAYFGGTFINYSVLR
jgi:hypothetical protein